MIIKKRPKTLSRFQNNSVSLSGAEYRDIALSSDDIVFEIYSGNIEGEYDLPEKKSISVTRQYILKNAVLRNTPDDAYYTVFLKECEEAKKIPIGKTRYFVIEGCEGTGKSTMTKKLYEYLNNKGYKCLLTKEPGTQHLPLTMALRKIMLDGQYEDQITATARELISQSIRSIHLEKLVYPAMEENTYDFIIQDRGVLSGLAYGTACGNDEEWLIDLAKDVSNKDIAGLFALYDNTIYLTGNVEAGLKRALASKQEFEAGDAMEARGNEFIENVSGNFKTMSQWFAADTINIDDKSIDQVFSEILELLELT